MMKSKYCEILNEIWPCALYLSCSLCMNLFTKSIITIFGWYNFISLAAFQQFFTIFIFHIGIHYKYIEMPSLSWTTCWKIVLPMAIIHSLNGIVGFASMEIVNMPMYLVLRRLTTFKVMLMEILLLQKHIPDAMKAALFITTIGSLVAGSHDGKSNGYGYLLVIVQNCLTALNLILVKKSNLTPTTLVYVNSLAGLCFTGPLAFLWERHAVLEFLTTMKNPLAFYGLFSIMSCMCLLYQIAIQICTIRTSPLATSVTGNVKDLASTLAGFILFPDASPTPIHVFGVGLSFLGAYGFSYVKYQMMFSPHSFITKPWRHWYQVTHAAIPTQGSKPLISPAKPKAY